MAFGNRFFLLLTLLIYWTYVDARSLVTYDIMGGESPKALERNEQLCTLCEEYTALATDYLNANKTETDVMKTLHQACSQMHSFEKQCVILVDYYGQLFFNEIGKIRPDEFCRKVNLCERISTRISMREDTCKLCRQVVTEIVTKLKDPDSQMEIIQILLKECNRMEQYAKECKRLVFRYGPLILVNGEKFLESNDICISIHACKANQEDGEPLIISESLVLDA
ncbi:uncharacterized protein A4U43_C08F33720 [Asparagus officinalis]|uniref:proactivator polypeptide-like 1 n=1 Tax=Asparagus officinalis TaxID=4686 RepID=UPI00098E454A|nr:proactivator polypeptide-like 1 [Asparagus officinalis]XP_020243828.1 proactivator polypeptide-like 1 [Asparagus officinalis]ONK61801.1 uncharacterized protein A4U43_C08F33720 [Asparagus officinalis]